VFLTQTDATAEVFESRPHFALSISGITKAAERSSPRLRRTGSGSVDETLFVLPFATFNIARREQNVAAEMMDASEFADHRVAFGRSLRVVEKAQSLVEPFAHAEALCETDLGFTESRFVGGRGDRETERGN
jgi:hypothetical protein